MGAGKNILTNMYKAEVDVMVGSAFEGTDGVITRDKISDDAYIMVEKMWDAIAKGMQSALEPYQFREILLFDGSTGRDFKPLPNCFIPEFEFKTGSDYEDFQENKEDQTLVPTFADPDVLDFVDLGYRVVIHDDKISYDSIIFFEFIALERGETNNLPDNFKHVSPGAYYVISQKDGEIQLHIQYKSCWRLRYMIADGELNKDSSPTFEPYV